MKGRIKRGEIYRVSLAGQKPQVFLVIQNDIGNKYCPSLIVVPLTKNLRARKLFFTMVVEGNGMSGLEQDYVALFFQIRTLDKGKFTPQARLGCLDKRMVEKMDELLKFSLGLTTLQRLETRLYYRKRSLKAREKQISAK